MTNYSQTTWERSLTAEVPYTVQYTSASVGALLLPDFRSHVRVDLSCEDADLARYLNTAARAFEEDTRRLLITTTVKEHFDVWPWDILSVVHLHRAPVQSITSVTYYDTDGNQQTWSSSDYNTDIINEPARIIVADNPTLSSPNLQTDLPNSATIEYVAGFGSDIEDIPPEVVNAIFMKASYLYGCGRELMFTVDESALERCWQNVIRSQVWSL